MKQRKWFWGLLIGIGVAILADLFFVFFVATETLCIETLSCQDKILSFLSALIFFVPVGATLGLFFGLFLEKRFYSALLILFLGIIGLYLIFVRSPFTQKMSQQIQHVNGNKDQGVTEENFVSEKDRITIIYPIGGEKLEVGKIYDIRWYRYNDSDKGPLTIVLQTTTQEGKVSTKIIASDIPAFSNGKYEWKVALENSENKYKIEVYPANGRELFGRSKDYFSIMPVTQTSGSVLFNIYTTPNNLAKESGEVFKFQYPVGFTVVEGGYKTPGGGRFPDISISKNGGAKIDVIRIPGGVSGGLDITCENYATETEKCVELKGQVVTTSSKDQSVLKAFDLIIATLEVGSF